MYMRHANRTNYKVLIDSTTILIHLSLFNLFNRNKHEIIVSQNKELRT